MAALRAFPVDAAARPAAGASTTDGEYILFSDANELWSIRTELQRLALHLPPMTAPPLRAHPCSQACNGAVEA
jgi:hypothetical protein